MSNDPTTPLAGLSSEEQPTIHRPPKTPTEPVQASGFTPGSIVASRYRIVALLGRGGMGEVYRADDLRLGHPVALKFLSIRTDHAEAIERLYHEVRVGRQVSHPNVCRLHDIVEAEGLRFIAMEYVDGEDLASLLRRVGRLPPAKGVEIAREIAAGLAAAHDRGIVHRDLKPGNVMIDGQGRAHITDFGLASIGEAEDGVIAGTAPYMAPEQVTGGGVSLRSDVYALGLVLYEIFTGERLYDTGSYAERRKERFRAARRVSSLVRDIDPAVESVIATCLSEDPSMRPASARAVLSMLPGGDAIDMAVAAGETPSPEMVAAATETGELPVRTAATLLAVAAGGLILITLQSQSFLFTLVRKPREVLADRAASVIALAGERSEPADDSQSFTFDRELVLGRWGLAPRQQVAALRPGVVRFVYRQSPTHLEPKELLLRGNVFIFQSGRVTLDDPPVNTRGSAAVVLDQNEALVEYRARPSTKGAGNWKPLLQSTGIDMRTLAPATPAVAAPVAADARVAWTARFPGAADRVRIEGASLEGQPAWLRVYGPWNALEPRKSAGPAIAFMDTLQLLEMIGFTIGAVIIVVRSLHRGRSDKRGALRLALYLGGCLFAAWLIAAHHASSAEHEARMFSQGLGEAAVSALVVWIFYIALEPGVRRTWPRALIGWTRLLAGRFRDPMVGREILIGTAMGGYAMFATQWLWMNAGSVRHLVHADAIDPLRQFIGDRLIGHAEAIEIPLGTMFMFLLARKAFGRIFGPVVLISLFVGYAFVNPGVPLYMLVILVVLTRFGLLTAVSLGCAAALLAQAPLTLNAAAWYWPRAAIVLLIVAGAAVWSARVAIGPRAMFSSLAADPAR